MIEMVALHRYWINANLLKEYFEHALESEGVEGLEVLRDSRAAQLMPLSDIWILMGYWYAAVYVVVEGYRDLKLADPAIDELLKSEHVARLRRFRNGMFHFQKEWLSPKLEELHEDLLHVDWIRELHSKLGIFLRDKLKSAMPDVLVARTEKKLTERKKTQQQGPPYLSARSLRDLLEP